MWELATLQAVNYRPFSSKCKASDVRCLRLSLFLLYEWLIKLPFRFMPADAFWTLAMAVNVYLTFYCKYDAQKLRKMEIPYLLCCYGLPFIVALTYIFIQTEEKGRMYGNATIWCWISSSWDAWRIGTFYGPVWYVPSFFLY